MTKKTESYFDKALSRTNSELVETMRNSLRGQKYDTIVGSGLSGTIFTARVAPGLRKKFAIVRKKDDHSTHSSIKIEGQAGKRFVVADDFSCSGATLKHILTMMSRIYPRARFVGFYQYEYGRYKDAEQCVDDYGNWVADIALGGPRLGPLTLSAFQARYPWETVVRPFPEGGWHPSIAEKMPLPPLREIELGYAGENGNPTYWSRETGMIRSTDPRVQKVSEEIVTATGGNFRRYVGLKVDTVMRTLRRPAVPNLQDWAASPGVLALQTFNQAVRDAESVAASLAFQLKGD